MSTGNMDLFAKDTLVEVSSDEGFLWWMSLFCYEGSKFVRPLPPPPPNDEQEQQRFEVNDVVDTYRNDGWWVGVESKVCGEEEQRVYSVLLENPSRTMNFKLVEVSSGLGW
ncbi:hypothetical protein Ddye_011407 [Dipteronia dyeriana]|uniref:Agenet domain-containing protein n=1 Tax=Dipteronia dyeriana TaxID=168575 RepID=A0AAE0CGW7_9ROSI|nr:hypothetical protein Ddye_011407 [Dipteronia dyeriana]